MPDRTNEKQINQLKRADDNVRQDQSTKAMQLAPA